jgi:hypothetical protein
MISESIFAVIDGITVPIAAVITLQVSILAALLNVMFRLVRVETQIGRIVSDIESEKDSRKRVHMDFEHRITKIEGKAHA